MNRTSMGLLLSLTFALLTTGCSRVPQWMSKYGRVSRGALSSLSAQDQAELAQLEERESNVPAAAGAQDDATFQPASFTEDRSLQSAQQTAADAFFEQQPTITTLPAGASLEDELARSQGLVLVDFYASWCGPCQQQGEILHDVEDVARQHHARIIKVDVDQHKALAERFRVKGIPVLVALKDGRVVDRFSGLTDAAELANVLRM